jgi:5-methylthioadenosine/S-adenosylhomocysteine deaminase
MPPQLKKTPIDYLADIEFLAAQPIIASATHLSRRDWQNLQTFGAKLVWTPRSSQNLGNPPLDWREARKYNISMALGTDGMSSVSSLSMWDEMRAAWTEAASHDVSACQIFKMATIQAAQVLGMDNLIGSLEIGKRADYVVVDMSEREVTPENIFQVLIENTKSYHVHAVAVDGKVLKSRQ